MPATPITKSNRFWRPSVSKSYFVPAIANISAPTRLELNAGTDLSREVASMGEWRIASEFLDAPDLASTFTSQVTGATSVEGAEIGFYEDKASVDVRDLLPRGTTGFHVLMYGGDVAGQKMNVYPITVGSVSPAVTLTDVAQIPVQFAVTGEPAENVSIPV